MTVLEQISHETMVFMRGKYRLDEIGDGKDELKFKQGRKTIVTVYIRDDRFSFLVIFGKKERECFDIQRSEFSQYICDCYDNSKTYHDGKWMLIDVKTLEQLEEVKKLILIKKKPNRKPFPKENALYSQCGQRCDLCVHYVYTSEELRAVMETHLIKMWGQTDWSMRCGGCCSDNCYCKDEPCHAKDCVSKKELAECRKCAGFPCIKATAADSRSMIHTEVHYADEITWGILPYVPGQYENLSLPMEQDYYEDETGNENRRKTPLMGWASWNCFRTDISEAKIKEQADALVSSGLADCGYTYVNMDDGFFGGRDEKGKLLFHSKRFPNGIKPIADYVHSLGLKAGIYSEAGDNTCGYYYDGEGKNGAGSGLYGHEEEDLQLFFKECGFDFLKVDWCGALRLGLDEETQYTKIGGIVEKWREKLHKPLVYNICRWQFPGEWAVKIADSWRTGADITPDFDSVLHQLDRIKPLRRFCLPGHVNDLDMMQIGNGLSPEEEKTHFAMWCMMSTPLMLGCDLTKMPEETLALLKNRELIAVNQDKACLQAFAAESIRSKEGALLGEIWVKELGGKDSSERAVALLNRSSESLIMEFVPERAGIAGRILQVRDLMEQKDLGWDENGTMIRVKVPPRGVKVYRVAGEGSCPVENCEPEREWKEKPLVQITFQKAQELMAEGAALVDVRTAEEYAREHQNGAINLPYTDIHAQAPSVLTDKARPTIVYCATGKRSAQAKGSLDCLGYERVYYLGRMK